MKRWAGVGAAAAMLVLAGCAGSAGGVRTKSSTSTAMPPAADSATVALWRFDENGGPLAADSGPFRLDGTAGIDTRTDFGRFHSARQFGIAVDSYVYVPYNPVLNIEGAFTVEAWIDVNSVSLYELQVVAARWTPVPNEQGWVLGVSGLNAIQGTSSQTAPGWFAPFMNAPAPQRLFFGYTPAGAGAPRGYTGTVELPTGRWVHVAASVDGEVVRLYVDGRLDAQYVNTSTVRSCPAPLVVGNAIDERHLTSFGGELRIDQSSNVGIYYPFDGLIDELRLSHGARTSFEGTNSR